MVKWLSFPMLHIWRLFDEGANGGQEPVVAHSYLFHGVNLEVILPARPRDLLNVATRGLPSLRFYTRWFSANVPEKPAVGLCEPECERRRHDRHELHSCN